MAFKYNSLVYLKKKTMVRSNIYYNTSIYITRQVFYEQVTSQRVIN